MTDDTPPETVPCPCGSGTATRRTETISEPYTFDSSKRAVHYHYRHRGCPIGGTIVYVDGTEHRRIGGLFHPQRYGLGNVPAANGQLAIDGGGA